MKVVTTTPESDTDLAARFTTEVQPLHDMLSRGAHRLTRSDADAEDLLQDTLLHAYAGFDTFAGGTNLKAWLFRILYNRWVSGYRYKQRRPCEICIDDVTEGHLLVVWHPVPPSIHALRDAVLAGSADAGDPLPIVSRSAPDAGVDDVEAAAGAVLLTTENFGMVSGLVKDFLERIYPWFEEVPDRRPGMPYLLVSKGGNDGTGAVRDVTRILTGLRWKPVLAPIVVAGPVSDAHLASVREQAATLVAGLDSGVF